MLPTRPTAPRPAAGPPAPPQTGSAPGRNGLSNRSWARWGPGALIELEPETLRAMAAPAVHGFLPHALRRPVTFTRSALLALRAGPADEAAALESAGLPMLFVWGDADRLIRPGALAGVPTALSDEKVGGHGWLLSRPAEFAQLLCHALVVHATVKRSRRGQPPAAAGAGLGELIPPERRRRGRLGAPASPAGTDQGR